MNRIEKFRPVLSSAQKAAVSKRWHDGFTRLPTDDRVALRIEARHGRAVMEPMSDAELAAHDAQCASLTSAEINAGFEAAGESAIAWLQKHEGEIAAGARCALCR